jgi:hypothetical protein
MTTYFDVSCFLLTAGESKRARLRLCPNKTLASVRVYIHVYPNGLSRRKERRQTRKRVLKKTAEKNTHLDLRKTKTLRNSGYYKTRNIYTLYLTSGAHVSGYGKWRSRGTRATQCPGV